MSPWLTFVVGVILGLLIGWLIDMFYRRGTDDRGELELDAAVPRPPAWAEPLPEAPADVAHAGVPEDAVQEVAEAEREPDWRDVSARVAEVAESSDEPAVAAPIGAHIADEVPDRGSPDTLSRDASDALAGSEPVAADARDKLILIEGVGPVYETKLNAAGIYTFRQLVAAGPERLREIVQPQGWQRVNFAEWIEQAQLLDEGRHEELKALQARLFSRKKG